MFYVFVQKSKWVCVCSQFEPLNHLNSLGYFKEDLQKGRSLGFYLLCLRNKNVEFSLSVLFYFSKVFSPERTYKPNSLENKQDYNVASTRGDSFG